MKIFKYISGYTFAFAIGSLTAFRVGSELFLSSNLLPALLYLSLGLFTASFFPIYFLRSQGLWLAFVAVLPFTSWSLLTSVLLIAENDLQGALIWIGLILFSLVLVMIPQYVVKSLKSIHSTD